MKIVYIAGPFRAPTAWQIAENIRAAERIGLLVARAGAMPLIPHANTAHFQGQRDDQFWLDGTMELLRVTDGAVFIPRWHLSSGSCREMRETARLKKPFIDLGSINEVYFQSEISAFVQRLNHGEDNQRKEPGQASQAEPYGARNSPE